MCTPSMADYHLHFTPSGHQEFLGQALAMLSTWTCSSAVGVLAITDEDEQKTRQVTMTALTPALSSAAGTWGC